MLRVLRSVFSNVSRDAFPEPLTGSGMTFWKGKPMPRVCSMPGNKKALRKKAALWLVSMGLGAALLAAPAGAQECPTNSQIIQRLIDDSIADYRATTGGNCP